MELVTLANIATPHIAGYSTESKLAAVTKLRDDCISHFAIGNLSKTKTNESLPNNSEKGLSADNLLAVLEQSFAIKALCESFKQSVNENRTLEFFDLARRQLLARREYRSLKVSYNCKSKFEASVLEQLGMKLN